MGREGEVKVKSLQKAMEVLECFIQKQPLGVTEISEKLGLYKSNVHNILMTFTALGYLTQDVETGKFRLGVSIMSLSRAFREGLDITRIAGPFMREIANEAGELIYLTIPKDDSVIYLEGISPDHQRMVSKSVAGEDCKMYCTAVGKAMLASMPKEEVEKCISGKLEAYTEIEKTRIRGYGIDDMEIMFGIKCVGVALLNHDGKVEGGLSISAPSLRMSDEKIELYANILKEYAAKIQKML